jgi:hypothetical protein
MPRFVLFLTAMCLCSALAERARAQDHVALMLPADRADAFAQHLTVQLASRTIGVVLTAPPDGTTAIARAAVAQARAAEMGARAAIWVDETVHGGALLRAVEPSGDGVAYAPLPSSLATVEPALFSAVAESLLDDLLGAVATAPPAVTVVNVTTLPAVPEPPELPPRYEPVAEEPAEGGLPDTFFAIRASGIFAGISAGGMLDASFYVSEHARLSVLGGVTGKFEDGNPASILGGTFSYITAIDQVRFAFGVEAFAILDTITSVAPILCISAPCDVPTNQETEFGFGLGGLAGVGVELGSFVLGIEAHVFGVSIDDDGFFLLSAVTPYLEVAFGP